VRIQSRSTRPYPIQWVTQFVQIAAPKIPSVFLSPDPAPVRKRFFFAKPVRRRMRRIRFRGYFRHFPYRIEKDMERRRREHRKAIATQGASSAQPNPANHTNIAENFPSLSPPLFLSLPVSGPRRFASYRHRPASIAAAVVGRGRDWPRRVAWRRLRLELRRVIGSCGAGPRIR
jgi:hypothetical protein